MKRADAYRVYLLLQGLTALGFSGAFTFNLVYQTSVAHLSPLQLVLVGTMLETSVFLFEVPTGIVADVYSRRLSIIIGVFLIGAGLVLEGSMPVFLTILLGQGLWGIGYTFTSGATQAWISDEIGEQAAGKAFLRGSQLGMVAGLAGILLSMGLVNQRINLPIQAGGGLFFLLGLLLILIMPENGFRPTPRQDRNTWQHMAYTFRQGLGMVKRRQALLTILAIGLFYGLYSEAYDRLWVKLLVDNFSLPALGQLRPEAWFAVLRAVGMVLSIAATEVARRKLDSGQVGQIAAGLFAVTGALIAGLLVFATAGVLGVAVAAYWLIGVARSVIEPLYTAWVNHRLDSSVRATVLSMSSQVDAIGQIAGGPALGLVGSLVSVRAAIAAASFILSPVLWLFTRARRDGEVELAVEQDVIA